MTRYRSYLAVEVVQTSAMDCGPASLKCLLEGFGISISYGRLREACQTTVDGTSIDAIEEVAVRLGLDAEQIMLPHDHLVIPAANALPALVVTKLPNGLSHFVVVWRRHGRFVQIMDPAAGRRWVSCRRLLDDLYLHQACVPASAWRAWAGSEEFLEPLRQRLSLLGIGVADVERLLGPRLESGSWRPLAALDAATRLVSAVIRSGGLRPGRRAGRVVEAFAERACHEAWDDAQSIPRPYWTVLPAPDEQGCEQVFVRGAVLVRVRGRSREDVRPAEPLSPELTAALAEPVARPTRELLAMMRADGVLGPAVVALAAVCSAAGVAAEALLFRGVYDLGRALGLTSQRIDAGIALVAFLTAMLVLRVASAAGTYGLGRRLELRFRARFLEKIPRLGDRYFQSRLATDMAERSHSIHALRTLPAMGETLCLALGELVFTIAGIAWISPSSMPLALALAILVVTLPFVAYGAIGERELRVRSHNAGLGRYYLDAMLGFAPLRAHGAERALRREYEGLLTEWIRASRGLHRLVVLAEGLQSVAGYGLALGLLAAYVGRGGDVGAILLLAYWALRVPALGEEIAAVVRRYPAVRNATLRLLEPLGAPEEGDETSGELHVEPAREPAAVSIRLHDVSVVASGHRILEAVDLSIGAGSHVAIVGSSGAGKSTLVGLLLGWHRPHTGRITVDGRDLGNDTLERLRRETVWVDPAVQIWNRSLFENLRYGAKASDEVSIARAVEEADLRSVLGRLPDGLQTRLGQGGALVSGGEGQRVRLGRAMARSDSRLVILDEPFRGLERERRRALLERARRVWAGATLLCVTHDVGETVGFERVLVVEGGRIVEDGSPAALAARADSRYRHLLEAERLVREGLWSGKVWRRLRLDSSRLTELPRLVEAPADAAGAVREGPQRIGSGGVT